MDSNQDVEAFGGFVEQVRHTSIQRDADAKLKLVQQYVQRQVGGGRTIVCVTSGGTTVPLEKRCVRFIDNFSSGSRGALSVEAFLKMGYGVIFLSREGSLQPFLNHVQHTATWEGALHVFDTPKAGSPPRVRDDRQGMVGELVASMRHVAAEGRLHVVHFSTVFDYILLLEGIAREMRALGRAAMLYLAAAVSDFYVPWHNLAEHKIQSSGGELKLNLHQVPKALPLLRSSWCPDAFVVSFKLETDQSILLDKAQRSARRNHANAVVANLLHTRKREVWLVGAQDGGVPQGDVEQAVLHIKLQPENGLIEKSIVQHLADRHAAYLESGG